MEKYETVLTVCIRPCMLGFDVSTYHVRIYESGFTQGQGFARMVGIFSSFGEVARHLLFTEEPFRVVLK